MHVGLYRPIYTQENRYTAIHACMGCCLILGACSTMHRYRYIDSLVIQACTVSVSKRSQNMPGFRLNRSRLGTFVERLDRSWTRTSNCMGYLSVSAEKVSIDVSSCLGCMASAARANLCTWRFGAVSSVRSRGKACDRGSEWRSSPELAYATVSRFLHSKYALGQNFDQWRMQAKLFAVLYIWKIVLLNWT